MIWMVSGFMRSGTSMMMRALEAGGLEASYRASRDELLARNSDEHYSPNPALYELKREDYRSPDFPQQFEGKLIKCLAPGMFKLRARSVADPYRVCFMRRDYEEIRQSYHAFFRASGMETEGIAEVIERAHGILSMRRDVDMATLWYRDVVANPMEAFTRLREDGWPIDVEKAAEVVNPALCRYKSEELDIGA